MEEKLAEFKLRKRREKLLNQSTELLSGIMNVFGKNSREASDVQVEEDREPLLSFDRTLAPSPVPSDSNVSVASSNVSAEVAWSPPSYLTLSTYLLYLLLWVTLYLIAIQFEFGYVYLIVSVLVFICFNTRTGPRRDGEVSAYSVFNPNCEAINGTLKAEQFEREFNLIRHDPVSPARGAATRVPS